VKREEIRLGRGRRSTDRPRHEIRSWLGRSGYEQVIGEASARQITVSACVRSCLDEYFVLRRELAGALGTDAKADRDEERGSRLAHALLERLEHSVVKEIHAQETRVDSLFDALRLLACMLDQSYQGLVTRLPEVDDDVRRQRIASAQEAAKRWRRAVKRLHDERGPEGIANSFRAK